MLYVGYHGRKGFWKLKEKFFQHRQPNLWTVLIAIFFFLRKDSLFLTLPNEMPKEILEAIGYAVFLYNCTVLKFCMPIFKANFAYSIFYFCQNTPVLPFFF